MKDADRQTRSRLMQLFEQQGRQPRHDLGQNFLVDLNLHELIVRHANLSTADVVLEVGTGTGGLTARLAESAGRVISVEFDELVYEQARENLAPYKNVTLIRGDALATKSTLNPQMMRTIGGALGEVRRREQAAYPPQASEDTAHNSGLTDESVPDEGPNPWVMQAMPTTLKLVANLPYNIATPLMSNLVASEVAWSRMVVTIQFELAERMLAKPGNGTYSALSVWLQAQADLKLIRKLPPSVFWPPPKVDSAVLRIERSPEKQSRIVDRAHLHDLVRDVFTQRRKQILGVLTQWSERQTADQLAEVSKAESTAQAVPAASENGARSRLASLLDELKIAPTSRPEQMTVEQFVKLSNALVGLSAKAPAADVRP